MVRSMKFKKSIPIWKVYITLILFLTVIISSLLLWQWKNFSEESVENRNSENEQVKQQISVEARGKELLITQSFLGLSNHKEYRVIKPDSIYRWQCKDYKGESCRSNDEKPDTFLASKSELNFQYVIPLQDQTSLLLTEWTSRIDTVKVIETTIEIVEKERKGGSWVAGVPKVGFKQMDLINYYTFKGKTDTPYLYWQAAPLFEQYDDQSISIYSEQLKSAGEHEAYKNLQLPNKMDYTVVIKTDKLQPTKGKGLMIVSSNSQLQMIEKDLINSYYVEKFKPLPPEEQWVFDLLTAMTLDIPATLPRSEAVLKELSNNLTEKKREKWLLSVQEHDKLLDYDTLDGLMETEKGFKTTFFSLNKNENSEFTPLYYIDQRKLMINGKMSPGLHIVYKGDQILFPFEQTLKAIGFTVEKSNDQTFILTKGKNQYTIYSNRPIFQYNGEVFGLLQNLLIPFKGILYIENKSLQSLFKVSVEEEGDKITLHTLY